MKVNTNQTAIDVSFDVCGSVAGFPTLLSQLPSGVRIGFDSLPDVWEDVLDIGQTWTPDLQDKDIDVNIKVYNSSALNKAPYGTFIEALGEAINWGNNLLPTLFDYTGWTVYDYLPDVAPESTKYKVESYQTALDVAFDLSGSITGFITLLDQLPKGLRIGFDTLPYTWEDVTPLGQTFTPDLQGQAFQISLPVYNNAAIMKRRYNTDINALLPSIEWGNDFLQGAIIAGDYLVDDVYDFLVDDYNNYITT